MNDEKNQVDLARKLATITEKVSGCEKQLGGLKQDLSHELATLCEKYKSLDKQLRGRPSWAVCIIISLLFGTCTTLTTVLAIVISI